MQVAVLADSFRTERVDLVALVAAVTAEQTVFHQQWEQMVLAAAVAVAAYSPVRVH
jgi:hypothetical protein